MNQQVLDKVGVDWIAKFGKRFLKLDIFIKKDKIEDFHSYLFLSLHLTNISYVQTILHTFHMAKILKEFYRVEIEVNFDEL